MSGSRCLSRVQSRVHIQRDVFKSSMMCSERVTPIVRPPKVFNEESQRSDIEPSTDEPCVMHDETKQESHPQDPTVTPNDVEKSPSPNDGMSEVGLEADEEVENLSLPRRNSETEVLLNGRISRCTTESHSLKSDSDIDLSSDENSANRQLQMKLLTLEQRLTELTTALAEEKERRMCDTAHFQRDKEEMLRKQEQLVRDLERMKKEKEAAVMKYAKSEHEAITATKARDSSEKKLSDMTKERDVYVARVRSLNQDYARLQSRLEARAGDLNKLERIIDRLTDEKSKAQQRLQDLEKYCDKLLAEQQQELLKTTTEQSNEFSSKLEETKVRLAECQKERDELYSRVTHLEDANRAHHENLSLSQIEIERLQAGLEQAIEDHACCPHREAESLQFTQQLTESTLKSQAENEQLKAQISLLTEDLDSFKEKNFNLDRGYNDAAERLRITSNECKCLRIRLADTERERDSSQRRVRELEHEKISVKRKSEQNVKQLSKELQIARKHLEELDSKNGAKSNGKETLQLDQRVLVERIVKLQKNLARKTEKIEFLEEHVKELTAEVNRKRTR